jgi:HTH-type transcriptional regulator/antitoxin HigA
MSKPKVFISYSHADEKRWKNRLQKHLKVLERHGSLSFWDDRRIAAGQEWRAEIKAALDSADAAILLISTDFLGSNFINDEEELERITDIVDRLAVKKNLSPEESRLLDLLSTLIEVYEDEHHPIPDAPPHVMIQGFMQDRGLRSKDLEPILGSSGVTSEVISGKRKPSKTQIKNLAKFFQVSPEFFIPSALE